MDRRLVPVVMTPIARTFARSVATAFEGAGRPDAGVRAQAQELIGVEKD